MYFLFILLLKSNTTASNDITRIFVINNNNKFSDMSKQEQSAEFCTSLMYFILLYRDQYNGIIDILSPEINTKGFITAFSSKYLKPAIFRVVRCIKNLKCSLKILKSTNTFINTALNNIQDDIKDDVRLVSFYNKLSKSKDMYDFSYVSDPICIMISILDDKTLDMYKEKKVLYDLYRYTSNNLLQRKCSDNVIRYNNDTLNQNDLFDFHCGLFFNREIQNRDNYFILINVNLFCIDTFTKIKKRLLAIRNKYNRKNFEFAKVNNKEDPILAAKYKEGVEDELLQFSNSIVRFSIEDCYSNSEKKLYNKLCTKREYEPNEEEKLLYGLLKHTFYFHVGRYLCVEGDWISDNSDAICEYIQYEIYNILHFRNKSRDQCKNSNRNSLNVNETYIFTLRKNKSYIF